MLMKNWCEWRWKFRQWNPRSKGIDVSRETSLEGFLVLDELVDEIGKAFKGGRRSLDQ
jgi:hypothetical protein